MALDIDMRPVDGVGAQVLTDAELGAMLDEGSVPGAATTVMSAVRERLQTKAAKEPLRFVVDARPEFSVSYASVLTADQLTKIEEHCTSMVGGRRKVHATKFAATVCATTCVAMHMDGRLIVDDDGKPVTLRSPIWREIHAKPDQWQAVVAFFDDEADLNAHSGAVVAKWQAAPVEA